MRLATFNILHGRSTTDGLVDLDRLRRSVTRIDADILALQEVDLDQPRSGMADLTAVAAEAMGAVSHRFVASLAGTPGATWIAATDEAAPGIGGYGIALLSRYPISSWQVVRLPHIPVRLPMYLPGPRRFVLVDEEPRAAMIARIETPLGPMTVGNTHLSFMPGWNRLQLRTVCRELRGYPGPHILMGDLNMVSAAAVRHSAMRPLASAKTFPADIPDRQLDHILTDGALRAESCSAPPMSVSDHRPLIADLTRR